MLYLLRRFLAPIVLGALVLGACSGDDSSSASTTTTTSIVRPTPDDLGPEVAPDPVDPTGTGLVCQPVGGAASTDAQLVVTLTEYQIRLDAETISSGDVFIQVENAGDAPHELKIARADRPEDLPTLANGAVDEEALGDDLVGEIALFANGDSCEGTFDLAAGSYVFFDNASSDNASGAVVGHFEAGMSATITAG